MRGDGALTVSAVVAVGVAIRIVVAFTNYGVRADTNTFYLVDHALHTAPLAVYDGLKWPYPGGFFPFVAVAHAVSHHLGLVFWKVIKLPAIGADAGLAITLW